MSSATFISKLDGTVLYARRLVAACVFGDTKLGLLSAAGWRGHPYFRDALQHPRHPKELVLEHPELGVVWTGSFKTRGSVVPERSEAISRILGIPVQKRVVLPLGVRFPLVCRGDESWLPAGRFRSLRVYPHPSAQPDVLQIGRVHVERRVVLSNHDSPRLAVEAYFGGAFATAEGDPRALMFAADARRALYLLQADVPRLILEAVDGLLSLSCKLGLSADPGGRFNHQTQLGQIVALPRVGDFGLALKLPGLERPRAVAGFFSPPITTEVSDAVHLPLALQRAEAAMLAAS